MSRKRHASEEGLEDMKTLMLKRYIEKFLICNINSFFDCELLQCLKSINIRSMKISFIPKNFGTLPQLEELDVSDNNLGAQEDWSWLEQTSTQNSLFALNLSGNSLTKFPVQVTKLNKLIILIVSCNKLTYLPQSIKNLKHLAVLDVRFNELSYLPMPSLVELSAGVIINQSVAQVAAKIPAILVRYLDEAKYCCNCGKACFDRHIREITDRIPYSIVATYVLKMTKTLQFECYYCSMYCSNQYHHLFNRISNRRRSYTTRN
ncbi:PREDICTED: plant intracellular Ras-group-related LRR protein 1-like isoform X2 [Vollenhovia emeryi]|uniref:plant intracellular Ras-group-related LRR protein 1-like isoform X2 n=1 Tax=Vollenhovia emeryi TaxID=411798 RepID=UPI0005F3E88E|nr:PREDICTED: plant intracellular Ras-group-related LRR protein 1-like isoform X2 [Vollenhovia emeryi]